MEIEGYDDEEEEEAPGKKVEDKERDDPKLDKQEVTMFRRLAATANFLAMDRADIQHAVQLICRDMSDPRVSSWAKLKRLARYLLGVPRFVLTFSNREFDLIEVYTESDWAGERSTRRSTSGGMVTTGGSLVKSWSKRQTVISTSNAEAEYYALGKGSVEALGVKAVMLDLGVKADVAKGPTGTRCIINVSPLFWVFPPPGQT